MELEEVKSVLTDEVVAEESTTEPTTNAVIPEETPPPAKKATHHDFCCISLQRQTQHGAEEQRSGNAKTKGEKRDRQLPFNKLFGLD